MAFVAASTFDIGSSYGKYERNTVLGQGKFGGRQILIKSAITGGIVGAELLIHRNYPSLDKLSTGFNLADTVFVTGVAVKNTRTK
jgi:hypothetical protein